MEFIVVPEAMNAKITQLAGFDEMDAADDVKDSCCGG